MSPQTTLRKRDHYLANYLRNHPHPPRPSTWRWMVRHDPETISSLAWTLFFVLSALILGPYIVQEALEGRWGIRSVLLGFWCVVCVPGLVYLCIYKIVRWNRVVRYGIPTIGRITAISQRNESNILLSVQVALPPAPLGGLKLSEEHQVKTTWLYHVKVGDQVHLLVHPDTKEGAISGPVE